MTIAFWFWLFYVLAIAFGFWAYGPSAVPNRPYWAPFSAGIVFWLLIGLLGYGVFGSPIK